MSNSCWARYPSVNFRRRRNVPVGKAKKEKAPWAWNNKHSNNHQPTNQQQHPSKEKYIQKRRKEKRNGVDVKLLVDYLLAVDSHHSGECVCMTPWISAINSLQPVCCCCCVNFFFVVVAFHLLFSLTFLSLYAFSFGIDSAELLPSWLLRNIRFIVGQSEFCRGATWMASQVAGDHESLLPIEQNNKKRENVTRKISRNILI